MTEPIHNPHRIAARVVADSISPTGVRLTTMEWDAPKLLQAQINTYGMLTRVSASGRAEPTRKLIQRTEADPYLTPTWHYRAPEGGMQPGAVASELDADLADQIVEEMFCAVLAGMHKLDEMKLAKEDLRFLEPWQYTTIVITGTEWDNYFDQRLGHDTQGPHRILAEAARDAMARSTPVPRPVLHTNDPSLLSAHHSWHLPYITPQERLTTHAIYLPRMSAVRISRVSYGHQGEPRSLHDELDRFDALVQNRHMSPLAQPAMVAPPGWYGNLRDWLPLRKCIGGESGSTTHGTQETLSPWGETDAARLAGFGL